MKSYYFFLCFLFLQGCSKNTPNCSDEETVKLIKQSVSNNITDNVKEDLKNKSVGSEVFSFLKSDAQINLLMIRTDKYDESIKKYECRADLEIKLSVDDTKYFQNNYWSVPFNIKTSSDGIISTSMNYISHKTDDNNHYVESSDLKPITKLVSYIISSRIYSDMSIQNTRGINDTPKKVKLIGVYDGGNTGYNFLNELDENNFYYMDKLPQEDFEKIADICKYDSSNIEKKCEVNVVMQGAYITKIESVEIIK